MVSPVWLHCLLYIFPPPLHIFPIFIFLPFSSFLRFLHFLTSPSLENMTVAILSYAVSHLHYLIENEKMNSRSVFRCAGHGPAVTHPSTDPAPRPALSCRLTWMIAGHRTPTTDRKPLINCVMYIVITATRIT